MAFDRGKAERPRIELLTNRRYSNGLSRLFLFVSESRLSSFQFS